MIFNEPFYQEDHYNTTGIDRQKKKNNKVFIKSRMKDNS